MANFLDFLKVSLEEIDHWRDRILFFFIKPFWPRKISPNQITYVRIVVSIALAVMLFYFNFTDKLIILSLFIFGALTDIFDGSVARGLNKETDFGAMLDPLADRLLILPIAIYSLYWHHRWLLLVLLLAEVVHGAISLFYKSHQKDAKANIFGKTRMVLLSLVFIVILIVWPDSPPMFFIDCLWFSLVLEFLSMFLIILDLKNKGLINPKYVKNL